MTYNIGDPNHIGVHNDLALEVQGYADDVGIEVDLPPQRLLGDKGHTDDHNKIVAAIQALADGGGLATGTPPAPVINSVNENLVTFSIAAGDEGPAIGAFANITPEAEYQIEFDQNSGDGSLTIRDDGGTYTVELFGVNKAGAGTPVEQELTFSFPAITGGDLPSGSIIEDYNDTGETWKVHQWTSAGSLEVTKNSTERFPFHVLLVGNGGRGGGDQGGGGGGGAVVVDDNAYLPRGQVHAVTIGPAQIGTTYVARNGGNGGSYDGGNGGRGGNGGGGGGGNSGGGGGATGDASPMGTTYQRGGTAKGGFGSPGQGGGAGSAAGLGGVREPYKSSITGAEVQYAGGGAQSSKSNTIGGGGNGGPNSAGASGGAGNAGQVIVAYQVGFTSPEAIARARAVKAARAEGYAAGVEDRNNELEAALAEAATAAFAEQHKKETHDE